MEDDLGWNCAEGLPTDVVGRIMSFLEKIEHLARAGQVNKVWCQLHVAPELWFRCMAASPYYEPPEAALVPRETDFDWRGWLKVCNRVFHSFKIPQVEVHLSHPDAKTATLGLAAAPDGRRCVSSHKDHIVRAFDAASGKCIQVFEGHPRTPFCIKVHPLSPAVMASACYEGLVCVWDLDTGMKKHETRVHGGAVSSINFMPNTMTADGLDSLLITCDRFVYKWQYETEVFIWNRGWSCGYGSSSTPAAWVILD